MRSQSLSVEKQKPATAAAAVAIALLLQICSPINKTHVLQSLYLSKTKPGSCHVVLGTLAALGHLPVDVLVGRLDVACLAVDAAGESRC